MPAKPTDASGYGPEATERVVRAGLSVATILGALLDDLVIVGGLVPGLLCPRTGDRASGAKPGMGRHVGTLDLDLGLSVGILDTQRYKEVAERLRRAGFGPDRNESGREIHQRWIAPSLGVGVDFLIPPTEREDRPGDLKHLEEHFAAIITPGLGLAFVDRTQIELRGRTHRDESARRMVWVCGPGAFVVLKALAVMMRAENKDAYDLYYVIRNFGSGPEEIAERIRSLPTEPDVGRAIGVLRADFATLDSIGPKRVAAFLMDEADELRADVVGFVQRLLVLLHD